MQRPKKISMTSSRSPQDVVRAALGVIEHGAYQLFALSNEHGRILFVSDKTLMSFPREFIAEVTGTGGGTTLDLVCGMVDGKPMGLIDGRKNKKFAETFVGEVTAVLDGTTSAPATPVDSFWTGDDGSRTPWNGTDLPQVWPGRG
jgi:hypothetical protein